MREFRANAAGVRSAHAEHTPGEGEEAEDATRDRPSGAPEGKGACSTPTRAPRGAPPTGGGSSVIVS